MWFLRTECLISWGKPGAHRARTEELMYLEEKSAGGMNRLRRRSKFGILIRRAWFSQTPPCKLVALPVSLDWVFHSPELQSQAGHWLPHRSAQLPTFLGNVLQFLSCCQNAVTRSYEPYFLCFSKIWIDLLSGHGVYQNGRECFSTVKFSPTNTTKQYIFLMPCPSVTHSEHFFQRLWVHEFQSTLDIVTIAWTKNQISHIHTHNKIQYIHSHSRRYTHIHTETQKHTHTCIDSQAHTSLITNDESHW